MQEIIAKLKAKNKELIIEINNSQVLNLLCFYPTERNGNCVSFNQCLPNDSISGEFEFRIIVHDESEFFGFTPVPKYDTQFIKKDCLQLGQSYYLRKEDDESSKRWSRLPTLHLSVLNMLSNNIYSYLPTFPRYASIMDNSIWNYYYSLETAKDDTDHQVLRGILCRIAINSFNKLYRLSNSLEYANHNARLIRESYISDPMGHGLNVSPFLFHSEMGRYSKVKEEYIKKDNLLYHKDHSFIYRWRILLLDDHVLEPMNYVKSESGEKSEEGLENKPRKDYVDIIPDKLRIISNDIRLVFPNCKIGYVKSDDDDQQIYDEKTNALVDKSDDIHIVFYCMSSMDNVVNVLRGRKFEIILLDYLLGERYDGTRQYSYELLNKLADIYKEKKKDTIFGPHGRMYFSFVSAFTTAVNERLLAEGLHKSEKFWYIADGACPTNTPYLFLYNLLHLMEKRIEDMGIKKLSLPDYKVEEEKFEQCHIKANIIDRIFGDIDIRKNANEYFDKVLSLLYHYKNLLRDTHNPGNIFESKESVLATDFIDKNPDLGGFLEHLTQLVYLTAFGTVRQWPEMWEEYQFIKPMVGVQESIEDYILELKNNNI